MAKTFDEQSSIGVTGHVLITDADTGEVILDKYNAINSENVAFIVASLLIGDSDISAITNLDYGIGGTNVATDGSIVYKVPRVDGVSVTGLYDWPEDIGGNRVTTEVSTTDNINNIKIISHPGEPYSDVVVTAVLDYAEPSGIFGYDPNTGDPIEMSDDDTANYVDGEFIFDEIALRACIDPVNDPNGGRYLTHLIFHPIQKSANRKIVITYTLRIRVGS